MNRLPIAVLTVTSLVAVATGCNDDKRPPYGSQMQQQQQQQLAGPSDASSAVPPSNEIPAGAQKLSQGTYNQIMFTIPDNAAGSLYLYDMDSQKVVGMTNSVASNAGKSMTMADLKNTAQGLNTTDTYQVYFAPTHPTTRPIGGAGM